MSKIIMAIDNDRKNCKEKLREAVLDYFGDEDDDFAELIERLMKIVEEYY